MKPSDIALVGIPLTATFDRVEREVAAAAIIYALAQSGDEWRSISGKEVGGLFRESRADDLPSWMTNPMVRPDVRSLQDSGHLEIVEDPISYRFTESGLDVLRRSRWNREKAVSDAP